MLMNKVKRVSLYLRTAVSIAIASSWGGASFAQVSSLGLPPAAGTGGSFVDASIVRDSEINQALDLLNDFYPAIEVTIYDHDNVRRRSDVDEQDLKISVQPSLAYRSNLGRHKFYLAYKGTFTFHDDLTEEDAQANDVNAQLALDLSHRWDLHLSAGVGESYEERGTSGSRGFNQLVPGLDDTVDDVNYAKLSADLIYGRKVSPLVGVLGFEKRTSDYQNNFQGSENPSGGRNRDVDTLHLDLSYQIANRTSIFGRIDHSEIDYDRSINSLDSNQEAYLLGLRWKPSTALSGTVGIGRTEKDFDDSVRADYQGSSYYANLVYNISPFSHLNLNASRFIEEPGDEFSDYYESDLLGVSWHHSLSYRLDFSAFVKWVDDDYNTDREDEFVDFGLGLDYIWRPWLSAGLYYGEIDRTSSLPGVDYEDKYFGIRLRSDLRSLLKRRGSRDYQRLDREIPEYR